MTMLMIMILITMMKSDHNNNGSNKPIMIIIMMIMIEIPVTSKGYLCVYVHEEAVLCVLMMENYDSTMMMRNIMMKMT